MRRRIVSLVVLAAFCAGLAAAAVQRPAERGTAAARPRDPVDDRSSNAVRVTTDRDGLPQNTVKSLALDHRGYLWVGTQDGAAAYNGRVWHTVNMPDRSTSNWINTIHVASDGAVLFGTNGAGVARLVDDEWTPLEPPMPEPKDRFVNDIAEAPGPNGSDALWIAASDGLFVLESGTWAKFGKSTGLPADEFTSIALTNGPAGEPIIWAGSESGVQRFTRGTWTTDGTASGLPDPYVYAIAVEPSDGGGSIVWAGTDAGLARHVDERWEAVPTPFGPAQPAIYSLLVTPDTAGGSIVRAGCSAGLAELRQGRWRTTDTQAGLPDNSVISLMATTDATGVAAVLAGTLSGGLAWLYEGQWRTLDTNTGLPDDHVYAFLESRGDVDGPVYWVGTYGGLARLDAGGWQITRGAGIPSDKVNCLLETQGPAGTVLWVGTIGGLARRDGARWTTIRSLPNNIVRCLLDTASPGGGRALWVGTYGGLVRMEGDATTVFDVQSGALRDNQVMALAETTSPATGTTIWAGTLGGGLARLRNGEWTTIDSTSGLPNNLVRSLCEIDTPDGRRTLWVGTLGGVAWLDLDAEERGWQVLTDATEPALPNNVVYGIRPDSRGRVYLSTNRGVARLTPRAPTHDNPAAFDVYGFTTEDGLPGNECNGGAIMVDRRGRVWVGTVDGAAIFDPADEVAPRGGEPLVVERVLVRDDHQTRAFRTIAGTALAYDQNNVTFEHSLLSFFKESSTRYRTQLVGFDGQPSPWDADATRTYTRLPAGEFTYRVWARDFSGNVTGPVEVQFSVRAAPWRTPWAYLLYFVTIVAAGYLIVRWRVSHFAEQNRVLEQRIAERTRELDAKNRALAQAFEKLVASEHEAIEANRAKSRFLANMSHELRTPLNAILGFVQLIRRRRTAEQEEREYLEIITASGEHLLGLINDVLSVAKIEAGKTTLNETAFDVDIMLRNVEVLFAMRSQERGIALRFDVVGAHTAMVCGDEGKLRQILINLIGNAIKFTDAGAVTVRVRFEGELARFEVEDTGHGIAADELDRLFEPFVQTESGLQSAEGTGLGLAISREFVRLMGGELSATSELGKGTTFSFEVDLPAAAGATLAEPRAVVSIEPRAEAPRVLVVDDHSVNRRLLVELLAPIGFEVREAANGALAVEEYKRWSPDIVLMDIRMSVMDGYEATRRIRAAADGSVPRRVTIIALSASVFHHDRAAVFEAGCDAFLPKPLVASDLFAAIAEHARVPLRYEQADVAAEAARRERVLTAEDVAHLSDSLREQLATAVREGDVQRAVDVTAVIRSTNEELATRLAAMVREYRFDELMALLDRSSDS